MYTVKVEFDLESGRKAVIQIFPEKMASKRCINVDGVEAKLFVDGKEINIDGGHVLSVNPEYMIEPTQDLEDLGLI